MLSAELGCAMRNCAACAWRPAQWCQWRRRQKRTHASGVLRSCLQITAAATAALAPRIAQLMDSRLAAATATVNAYFHLIKKDDGAASTLSGQALLPKLTPQHLASDLSGSCAP